jgi:hypothetical protein
VHGRFVVPSDVGEGPGFAGGNLQFHIADIVRAWIVRERVQEGFSQRLLGPWGDWGRGASGVWVGRPSKRIVFLRLG